MARDIPVFRAERDAGLAELVRTSASVAYASQALIALAGQVKLSRRARASLKARATNEGQPDLHYLKTVLVSTGWNKNDDVFDPLETWLARHSPEDKPFNYEHNCDDILGHITGNFVVDEDYKPVADDLLADDLPGRFHVITTAVMYKVWGSLDLQERMDKVLQEIPEGKWFVSMEALFRGFDYAIVKPDKSVAFLARNDKTAFLTKHLRAYGGDGHYKDVRVGRLLRQIVFSGKGLVRKPANPDSIIFSETENFDTRAGQIVASGQELEYGTSTTIPRGKATVMADTDTTKTRVNSLKGKLKAQAELIEQLQNELKHIDSEKVKAREESLSTEVKARDEQLKTTQAELVAAQEKVKAADEQVATWKTRAEEFEKAAQAARLENALQKDEARKTARLATLKASYGCDEARALDLLSKLDALDDAAFAAHADYMAEKLEEFKKASTDRPATALPERGDVGTGPNRDPSENVAQKPPQQTSLPAPMAGEHKVVRTITTASTDPALLDRVEPNPSVALTSQVNGDEETEKTRAQIATYMANYFDLDDQDDD